MPEQTPNKPVSDFTTDELIAYANQNEHNPNPVVRSIVRDCDQELARRRGIRTPRV